MFTDPTYPVVVLEPPPDLVVVHLVERGVITSTQASHRSPREGRGQLHLHSVTVRFVSLYDSVSTSTYYGGVVKSFPDGEGKEEGGWSRDDWKAGGLP